MWLVLWSCQIVAMLDHVMVTLDFGVMVIHKAKS